MITIVDYGMGNLRNVKRAIEQIGGEALVTSDPDVVARASKVILPGVGAFGEAVRRIDVLGLRAPLLRHCAGGKPLIGICLGMQLLFEQSEENPGAVGLSLLHGSVIRFGPGAKVPHIGWNDVTPRGNSTIFPDGGGGGCFYFVHSYYVPDSDAKAATTFHGIEFVSAVERGNIIGVQFHPEKSQKAGMELLRRFALTS